MLNHYDLFVTRITQTKFPIQVNLFNRITEYVNKNYVSSDTNTYSNYYGFQNHNDFDGKEELNKLLNTFFQNNFNIDLAHGWLNVLDGNAFNLPHRHAEADKSAVLYLSNNNNSIVFLRENQIHEFKPRLFDLLIFPADLLHYVLPSQNKEKRICYAVNLIERKVC